MSFNYFANGEYIIEKDNLFENFEPVTETERLAEGFAENEDPYIQEKMPCFSDIDGVNQSCSDKKYTIIFSLDSPVYP